MSLQPIDSLDAIRQARVGLEHVIRFGLAPMDRMDAEKVVTAVALLLLVEEAQKVTK
jgi:hypothetical protein